MPHLTSNARRHTARALVQYSGGEVDRLLLAEPENDLGGHCAARREYRQDLPLALRQQSRGGCRRRHRRDRHAVRDRFHEPRRVMPENVVTRRNLIVQVDERRAPLTPAPNSEYRDLDALHLHRRGGGSWLRGLLSGLSWSWHHDWRRRRPRPGRQQPGLVEDGDQAADGSKHRRHPGQYTRKRRPPRPAIAALRLGHPPAVPAAPRRLAPADARPRVSRRPRTAPPPPPPRRQAATAPRSSSGRAGRPRRTPPPPGPPPRSSPAPAA